MMKVTILGSGTSTGVPQIGCTCEVCTSKDERDKRLRCAGLVDAGGVRILIDCGPDFREQMLRLKDFRAIDGVLITHEHYDHVGGLDDLRPFCVFKDVPVYAENYTADRLKTRMPYCFVEHPYPGVPSIPVTEVKPGVPFRVPDAGGEEVEIIPFRVMHGKLPILGYRIGQMAWITDMTQLPDESYDFLQGLDLLVMNALRITPHWTHQSLGQALEQAHRIGAHQTCLVHISHQMGLHARVSESLPPGVCLACDGMSIDL